jgi:hypothetical protein
MKITYQRTLILITTAIVMVFSLFNPSTVFADDDLPPTEPLATEETSSIPTDQAVFEPAPVSEVLEELPEDIEVIVLDEDNDVVPLAAQKAADIVAENDPMWCPSGQKPGDSGCTASYLTVTDLISNLGSKSGAGTIYFTPTYSVNDAVFDHTNVNLSALTDLTIQGGWNGLTGSGFSLYGNTIFSGVSLSIEWQDNITIRDIAINNASDFGARVITVDGDVTVHNVVVENTLEILPGGSSGAIFATNEGDILFTGNNKFNNNGYGLSVVAGPGNIKLNNTIATGNTHNGISMAGDGKISLNNVVANNNGDVLLSYGLGILISTNTGDVSLKNIIANENSSGIDISGADSIVMNNIIANNNDIAGIVIYADADPSNVFGNNIRAQGNGIGMYVLDLESTANINLKNVFMSQNDLGFEINTMDKPLTLHISCSEFNGNSWMPIFLNGAWEQEQTVILNGVTMSNNGYDAIAGSGNLSVLKNDGGCDEKNKKTVIGSLRTVAVTDGEIVDLDCISFTGTVLILPNANKTIFNCPVVGSGSLGLLDVDGLPGNLPEDVEFVSGMQTAQSPLGSDRALDGQVTISFLISESFKDAGLAVLYWDGNSWVDLKSASFEDGRKVFNGGYFTDNGYFEAATNFSGIFVLVKK